MKCPVCDSQFDGRKHPDTTCALGAVLVGETLLPEALRLAALGFWAFSLSGKQPWKGCSPRCERGCPTYQCHSFLDATQEPLRLAVMWARQPTSNIGLRPGPNQFVVDVDPRNGGSVPDGLVPTLSAESGRGDGGVHLWYTGVNPGSLGRGIDTKGFGGYVVAPPSIHPDTGLPYRWTNWVPIAEWVRPESVPERRRGGGGGSGGLTLREMDFPLDWQDILAPHGWRELAGEAWLHPTATSALSARVVNDLLYVFSTSTVFDASSSGEPRGYSRWEAYALINDITDLLAALTQAKESAA